VEAHVEWILDRFAEPILSTLIDTILKGSLVGAALIVGTTALGGRRARLRGLLLNIGILALVAIPIISIQQNFSITLPAEQSAIGSQAIDTSVPSIPIPVSLDQISVELLMIPGLYLLGILVLGSRVLSSLYGLFKLNRTCVPINNASMIDQLARVRDSIGIRRNVGLRASPSVESPCQMGILTPAVILPADMKFSRDALETIFLHELVHIKRHDCFYKMLGSVCLALHWFNPLVWGVVRRCSRVQDQVCDDWVVYLQKSPDHYVETLISVVRGFRTPGSFTYQMDMAQGSGLLERIRRIRELGGLTPTLGSAGLTVSVMTGLALLAMVGFLRIGIAPVEAVTAVLEPVTTLDSQAAPVASVQPIPARRPTVSPVRQPLSRPEAWIVITQVAEEPDAWLSPAVLALAGSIDPISRLQKVERQKISNEDIMLYPDPKSYVDILEVHELTPPAGASYQTTLTMGEVIGTMFYSRPFHTGESASEREAEAQRVADQSGQKSGGGSTGTIKKAK